MFLKFDLSEFVMKYTKLLKILYFVLSVGLILSFTACNRDTVETSTTIIQNEIIESNVFTDISESSNEDTKTVNIIEDYLTPIEKYSWERKYDAEFVMVHFCSALLVDFENPYDLKTVRQMFIDYEVSIHYIIDRDGTVYCYVPESRVAWHAGKGTWNNDEKYTNDMNQYAIGIEMLAIGSQRDMSQYLTKEEYEKIEPSLIGYTDSQYKSLNELIDYICKNNDIPKDKQHIIGHQEYKASKSDPGELFDWKRILN